MSQKNLGLFLDSGAYSAYSTGVPVNLGEYANFIKGLQKITDGLTVYANLDVIGDPEATLANQKQMEEWGLNPLPCFHCGEDFNLLKTYVKKYDYIALGGMVTSDRALIGNFLEKAWNIICGTSDRMPQCKVHGFGMTSLDLMFKYPWWSVDSTAWVMISRTGGVLIPKKVNGKYDYHQSPWKISVSNKSPSVKMEGEHFSSKTLMEQAVFLNYFEEKGFKMGKSEFKTESRRGDKSKGIPPYELKENEKWWGKEEADLQRMKSTITGKEGYVSWGWGEDDMVEIIIEPGLSNDYKMRDKMNVIYYGDLQEQFPPWPWPYIVTKRKGFGLI